MKHWDGCDCTDTLADDRGLYCALCGTALLHPALSLLLGGNERSMCATLGGTDNEDRVSAGNAPGPLREIGPPDA